MTLFQTNDEECGVRVSLRPIKLEKECPRKEGYEIRSTNLTTDSKAASGVQHWKAQKITLRNENKMMNLD